MKRLAWIIGVLSAIAPAAARGSDSEKLLALHAEVMKAHLASDVEILLASEPDDYVVAGRGEITRPTKAERRAGLGPYLKETRFAEYRDLVEPIVKVSPDGRLGWVVVQVSGNGIRKSPDGSEKPVEFVSAWIELYEKRDGRWYRTGNVSNFKP